MPDPVNLNRFRKAKARTAAQAQAAANRALHGRTRAEKRADAAEIERRERELDGTKRDLSRDGAYRSRDDRHGQEYAGD